MGRRFSTTWLILTLVGALGAVQSAERHEATWSYEQAARSGGRFSLENLIGSIEIRTGRHTGLVRVDARVVAEAATEEEARALADAVRPVAVSDTAVRISYPAEHTRLRVPRSEKHGVIAKWVSPALNKQRVTAPYGGRTVGIGPGDDAVALSADLTVYLPFDLVSSFRQVVGSVEVVSMRGQMQVELLEGLLQAEQLFGSLDARSAGGQVRISLFQGERLDVSTKSGRIELAEVRADEIGLRTGTGRIVGGTLDAERMRVQTTSGDVVLDDFDSAAISVESESGNVELGARLVKARQITARSVTGDVTLRAGEHTRFQLAASSHSGRVKTRGIDLEPLGSIDGELRLSRGLGGAMIRLIAPGGDVLVRPYAGNWFTRLTQGRD